MLRGKVEELSNAEEKNLLGRLAALIQWTIRNVPLPIPGDEAGSSGVQTGSQERWRKAAAHPVAVPRHLPARRGSDGAAVRLSRAGQERPAPGRRCMVPGDLQRRISCRPNKDDRTSTATMMYKDYAISLELFHWESQNATSAGGPTGRRYLDRASHGSKILIFTRGTAGYKTGLTVPYTCLGQVDYVQDTAEKPIAITWKLQRSVSEDVYATAAAVAQWARNRCSQVCSVPPIAQFPPYYVQSPQRCNFGPRSQICNFFPVGELAREVFLNSLKPFQPIIRPAPAILERNGSACALTVAITDVVVE